MAVPPQTALNCKDLVMPPGDRVLYKRARATASEITVYCSDWTSVLSDDNWAKPRTW